MSRPSETAGVAGAGLGALVVGALGEAFGIALGPYTTGLIILAVGSIPAGVTWFVARKQRSGELSSLSDGSVKT